RSTELDFGNANALGFKSPQRIGHILELNRDMARIKTDAYVTPDQLARAEIAARDFRAQILVTCREKHIVKKANRLIRGFEVAGWLRLEAEMDFPASRAENFIELNHAIRQVTRHRFHIHSGSDPRFERARHGADAAADALRQQVGED